MPLPDTKLSAIKGLSESEIPGLQSQFGKNIFRKKDSNNFQKALLDVVQEPMFILLICTSVLYILLSQWNEAIMMLVAIGFVSAISLYQVRRSNTALKALEKFKEPKAKLIRDGKEIMIPSAELVPGDLLVLEEGNKIPADALIIQSNDFSVNESIITGESLPVDKFADSSDNRVFQGTIVNSGKAYATVDAIGNQTMLGKLGEQISITTGNKSALQVQIRVMVLRLTYFGISAFLLIWILSYIRTGLLIESLLLGLTLAMAAIPEEIPVAFSSFMALGAYHMAKIGIITRQPQTIENLGAVNVICLDKTGTITENKMAVKTVYDFENDLFVNLGQKENSGTRQVLYYAMLASEREPFDPMEKAILESYKTVADVKLPDLPFVHEYPLAGRPPMMTHVYQYENIYVVAAKGAIEKIIEVCSLDSASIKKINDYVKQMAIKGYRVIGVASSIHAEKLMPVLQETFNWKFEGLLGIYDPPKKDVDLVFAKMYAANIEIKILSGDYPETVINIASQTGIKATQTCLTGDMVMQMSPEELRSQIKNINLFGRMFPEAKVRIIQSLKESGNIVAMIGDGVNDGPALKISDIGIAMGEKGTEIARSAADLVVTDDDLNKVVEAIRQGRKIFSNLKKAVRYIISIHIPIILIAAIPVLFGWAYPNIFTPIHVIFLELIMGPTCSIFFELEPVDKNIMEQNPAARSLKLFRKDEILITIVQGIVIAAGILILYYVFMHNKRSLNETKAVVFSTLLLSNILLTLTNRSFTENFLKTFRYKNKLAPWIIIVSLALLVFTQLVPAIRHVFGFSMLQFSDIILCIGVAFASVLWFEVYKTYITRKK